MPLKDLDDADVAALYVALTFTPLEDGQEPTSEFVRAYEGLCEDVEAEFESRDLSIDSFFA